MYDADILMLFVPEDLITREWCFRAIKKIDYFFHPVAQVCGIYYVHRENIADPALYALMSQHMLEIPRINSVNRSFSASYACIYHQHHNDLNRLVRNQAIPADSHRTYRWVKMLDEVSCYAYHSGCNFDCAMACILKEYNARRIIRLENAQNISLCIWRAIEYLDCEFNMFGGES